MAFEGLSSRLQAITKKMKCLLGAINSCISEFEQRYLIERAKDDKEIGD